MESHQGDGCVCCSLSLITGEIIARLRRFPTSDVDPNLTTPTHSCYVFFAPNDVYLYEYVSLGHGCGTNKMRLSDIQDEHLKAERSGLVLFK